jgi:hypothetical protein
MTCAARCSSSSSWKTASVRLRPSCATLTPSSRSRSPANRSYASPQVRAVTKTARPASA